MFIMSVVKLKKNKDSEKKSEDIEVNLEGIEWKFLEVNGNELR